MIKDKERYRLSRKYHNEAIAKLIDIIATLTKEAYKKGYIAKGIEDVTN